MENGKMEERMEKNMRRIQGIKRIHAAIPEELYWDLVHEKLLGDIDNIVSKLLYEKVEEVRNGRREEKERFPL